MALGHHLAQQRKYHSGFGLLITGASKADDPNMLQPSNLQDMLNQGLRGVTYIKGLPILSGLAGRRPHRQPSRWHGGTSR